MDTKQNSTRPLALGLVVAGFLTGICIAQIGEKGDVGGEKVTPVSVPASAAKLLSSPLATEIVVLDFEDLPAADVGRLPANYAGLEWDSFEAGDPKWWDWSSESVDPSYSQPHSGDNYLFNAFGRNSVGFSLPNSTDQLLGAWFAKAAGSGGTPSQVRFNGFNAAHSLIEQSSWLTLASTPRHLEVDFGPVDRIEVEHSSSGDATYSMDDLSYQTGSSGGGGSPPAAPTDPSPSDAAEDVPVDVCLSWDGAPLVLSSAGASLDAPARALEEEQKNRLDLENVATNPVGPAETRASILSEALADTQDTVGSALLSGNGSGDGVGDFYSVTTDVQLVKIESRLSIPDSMTVRYFVYESATVNGTYNKIFEKEVTGAGTGQQWYSSGDIAVALAAGKYYFIGISWQGSATYYYDFSAPNVVSFGTQLSGSHRSYPPTATKTYSANQLAYYQRLTTSTVAPPSPATSWDLYLGTNPEELELVATDLDQPTYCPGCLEAWTTYYWTVVAKNSFGEKGGPIWSFKTIRPVDLNRDGVVDVADLDLFLERWLQAILAP